MAKHDVTGIILSGGRGERLAGRDKGLCEYQSKTLISHCIESLSPQVHSTLISCNRNLDEYSGYGLALVTDERKNFQGPLAGVEAALRHCVTEYALIWPVDSQPIPAELVSTLLDDLTKHDADIVYLEQPHKPQYLIALIRSSLQPSLTDYLNSRQRKVRDWYAMHNTIGCDKFSDTDIKNLNTPELF